MDFDLNEEQEMIRRTVRDFADKEIVPVARENDRTETFPADILRKMAGLGLLGAPIPEEYGGAGMDYIAYAIMTEEIGRGCSSLRTTLSVHISLVQLTILEWASEGQKRQYLPRLASGEWLGCFGLTEPNAGSDAANQQTMAVRDGDSWVLNGNKMFISNGGKADLAIVFAQTDRSLGHRGLAAFLVERSTPGFSTKDIHGKLGMRSSNTAELIFQDCRIPGDALMGQVGDGFKIAMAALDNGRFSVAAGSVGICQACIEASKKYALERQQFGKAIANFQLVQELIADMTTDTEAARLLVYRAAHVKNKHQRNTFETSLAKHFSTEAALRCAYNAIQVHGGYGYIDEYPVERYWRDARVATLYEGTTQVQKLIIGRHVLGVNAFV